MADFNEADTKHASGSRLEASGQKMCSFILNKIKEGTGMIDNSSEKYVKKIMFICRKRK
jgi:hypothetical protein